MIPAIYKLKLRKIANFFQSCERYYSKYFLVFYRQKIEGGSRLVVVVPKKNIKLRVRRSMIKRQVYNQCLPLLKESEKLDIALVANKKIELVKNEELFNDLKEIFSKLGQK